MKFTKMHGIGNDYVYVNGFEQSIQNPAEVAQKVSDRHFGIGSDGLILILPSEKGDVRMRMFNGDGSESEMCGNGVRCVAKYAFDHGLTRNNPMRVETGRGVLEISLELQAGKVRQATVNMGRPLLKLEEIPVDPARLRQQQGNHSYALFDDEGKELAVATFVSMGNPHAVIFVDRDVSLIDVAGLGPIIERHPAFPRRINVHWVQVHSRKEVTMRTWERGSGITLACGTGASAVAVAGVLQNLTDPTVLAHLPGGDLTLEWRKADDCLYMTGPAAEVFSGEWSDPSAF